ncbi:MAG: porin family protein [Deferrisomatales bacterium]
MPGLWLGVLAIGLGGAPAPAQEAASPTAFEQDLLRYRSFFDYGGFEPSLEGLVPEGYASRWRATLGLDGTYTDNVDKDRAKRSAFSSDATLGVGWVRTSPRLKGSADYRFLTDVYRSDAVSGREGSSHRVAGAIDWRALERVTVSGGGHYAQELQQGIEAANPGVRSTHGNRFDEYGAQVAATWQASRDLVGRGAYQFRGRDYVSDRAEGADSRAHQASTSADWRVAPRDTLSLAYGYSLDEEPGSSLERQRHEITAAWARSFLSFPAGSRSALKLSYGAERGLSSPGTDHWIHSGTAAYSAGLGPRTSAGVNAGFQWIEPAAGGSTWAASGGAHLTHQVSAQVQAEASAGHAWEYAPASSRDEFNELSRVTRAQGGLSWRLSRTQSFGLTVHHRDVRAERDLAVRTTGRYQESGAAASLSGALGRDAFWGLSYSPSIRTGDGADEDYRLQVARLYGKSRLGWRWLWGEASLSREQRDYGAGSRVDDYHENRAYVSLRAEL